MTNISFSSKVQAFKELYPTQTAFQTTLKTVSQSKFGKVLYVNNRGKLTEGNLFRIMYEKIKGWFHLRDGTNSLLIEETTVKFLQEGKEWLTKEDLEKDIPLLIRRVGLVSSDPKSVQQHSNLIEAITKLSIEILPFKNERQEYERQEHPPFSESESQGTPDKKEESFHQSQQGKKSLIQKEEETDEVEKIFKPSSLIEEPLSLKTQPLVSDKELPAISASKVSEQKLNTELSRGKSAAIKKIALGVLALLGGVLVVQAYQAKHLDNEVKQIDPVTPTDTRPSPQASFQSSSFKLEGPLFPFNETDVASSNAVPSDVSPSQASSFKREEALPVSDETDAAPSSSSHFNFAHSQEAERVSTHTETAWEVAKYVSGFGLISLVGAVMARYLRTGKVIAGPNKEESPVKDLGPPILNKKDSSLEDSCPRITERLLMQINGDSFTRGTPAEGEAGINVINYVREFLVRLNEPQLVTIFGDEGVEKRTELVDLLSSASACDAIAKQQNVVEAANHLKTHLQERLAKGQPCLLLGGWAGSPAGHAIYYELIPQEKGGIFSSAKFTFRAYNRGAGVEYQQGATLFYEEGNLPKLLYPAFLEINDIQADDLLDEITLRALIELTKNTTVPGTQMSTNYSVLDLQRVIKLLKGKEAPLDLKMEELMNVHYSGLCAFKSLSACLSKHLSLTQYERFIFFIKQQSFWNYTHHQLEKIEIPSTQYELYSKSLESFSHALRRAKELGTISSEEHDLSVSQLAIVEKALEERKKSELEKMAASAPTAPTAHGSSSHWKMIKAPEIPPPIAFISNRKIPDANPQTLSLDVSFDPKDIVSSLESIKSKFKRAQKSGLYGEEQYDQIVKAFRELVHQLPSPCAEHNPDKDIWQQIAKTNIPKAVSALCELAQLGEIFFNNLMYSQQGLTGALDPEVFVDIYTIICIMDDILIHAKLEDKGVLGINPLPDYRALSIFLGKPIRSKHVDAKKIEEKLKRNFTFQLKDPFQRAKLQALHEYLEKRADETKAGVVQPFAFESRTERPFTFRSTLKKKDVDAKDRLNPEFEYFDNIRKNPTLFEKFSLEVEKAFPGSKHYQGFKEKSPFLSISVMSNAEGNNGNFSLEWNRAFYYWRRINAEARQILMGHVMPLSSRMDFGSCLTPIKGEAENYTCWYRSCGSDRLDKYRNESFCQQAKEWEGSSLDNIIPPEEKFRLNFRTIEDEKLKDVLAFLEHRPNLSENDVKMFKRPLGVSGKEIKIELEEFQQLLLLATNKPLQIDRLIAYYSNKLPSLSNVDTQTFFKLLFFEHEVLPGALLKSPELYQALMKFIDKGYQAAKRIDDLQACMFYLNLSKQVEREFLYLKSQQNEEWLARANETYHKAPRIDGLAEIKGLLENKSFSDQQRSLLFFNLIAFYSPADLVKHDLLYLVIEGIGHLNRNPLSLDYQDPELTRQFDDSIHSIEKQLQTALESNPKEIFKILFKSNPELVKEISTKEWKTCYPFCQSTDDKFLLNVKTGLILVNGKARTSMPTCLLPQLPKDSYRQGDPVEAIGLNHLEFVDINAQRIRLTVNDTSTEVRQVQRTNQEGRVLRLIPALPAPAKVISDCQFWLDDKTSECFATKGASEGYLPLYHYHLDKNTQEIKHVEKFRSKAEAGIYIVEDISKSNFQWLKKIESEEHMLLLADPNGSPRLLEFPRLGLKFEVTKNREGNALWMCNQRPGFYLAKSQHAKVLAKLGVKGYLLLENEAGQQELLMPVYRHGDRETSYGYYRYEYNVSPSGEGRHMKSSSSEANLYLAYQALSSKLPEGYSMAHALLRPQFSVDPKPTDQALKIASWIVELSGYIQDFDPRAVACRLKAAHLCELIQKAHKLNSQSPKIDIDENYWECLENDLECYIQKIKRTGAFRLEESVELELLEHTSQHRSLKTRSSFYLKRLKPGSVSSPPKGLVRIEISSTAYDAAILTTEMNGELKNTLKKAMKEAMLKDTSKIPDVCLYTRPDQQMPHLFLHFLPHALKEKDDAKKRELRRFLEVAREDDNRLSQILRAALEEICNNPTVYKPLILQKEGSKDYIPYLITDVIIPASKKMAGETKANSKKLVPFKERQGSRQSLPLLQPPVISRRPDAFTQTSSLPHDVSEVQEIHEVQKIDLGDYVQAVDEKRDYTLLDYTRKKLTTLFSSSQEQRGLKAKEFSCKRADVENYIQSQKERPLKTEQLQDEKIPKLMADLKQLIIYRRQEEKAIRENILTDVNQGLYGTLSSPQYVALRLAKQHEALSMQDLLLIHGRKEHHLLTADDKQKEESLFNKLKDYLDYANETQKYARGLKLLKDWQEEPISEIQSRQLFKDNAWETLRNQPCYETKDHPERQVIEHLLDLSIRHDQVKAFELLDEVQVKPGGGQVKPGVVMEAIPGFGKTSLIMPLYALLQANGKNLCVIIVPDQMVDWISDELKSKIGPSFDIWLRSLNIGAASELSLEQLNETHDFLEEVRKKKQALIMGTKSAHCLNIQSDKALVKCCRDGFNSTSQLQLEKILDITTLFEEKSLPIGDEFHIFYHTRSEVNSPSGKPYSLPEEEQLLLVTLYDTLLLDPKIRALFRFDFASEEIVSKAEEQKDSKAEPFTEEVYRQKAKTLIVDSMLERLRKEPLAKTPKAILLHKAMAAFKNEEIELLRLYLLSEKDKDADRYDAAYLFLEKIQDSAVSNVLHLLAEELETLLPYSLKKKCDEGYSLASRTAIPSKNGLPQIGSEFGNPHETANYSIQAVIKHGIPKGVIEQLIKELQESILKQLPKRANVKKTEAYSKFLALSAHNKDRNPLSLSAQDIEEIIEEINSSQKMRREFVLKFILPEIRFYTAKYNSNCYRLARLMPKMRGVTGTLAENYAYSDNFAVTPSPGTLSRSLFTLYSHCLTQNGNEVIEVPNVILVNSESPSTLLQTIKSKLNEREKVRMVTDAAGYLNGCDIERLAEEWSDELKKVDETVEGVCHHQNGKPVIYESSSKETNPLQDSLLKPVNRFTVLSQPYVTGTDTQQGSKIVEIVTVGRNTPLSLLIQAAWRARQIHAGQRVNFVISKDVEIVLRKALQLSESQPITLDELILFTFQNEIDALGLDNISGARLQMQEYVQNEIYRTIKSCRKQGISYGDLMIPEVANLFEFPTPQEARHRYGGKSEADEAQKILQSDVERVFSQFKKVWDKSSTLQDSVTLETVKKGLEEFIKLEIVPEKFDTRQSTHHIGTEVTVEVAEQDSSKEQQKQVETNRQVIAEKVSGPLNFWRHLPWSQTRPPQDDTLALANQDTIKKDALEPNRALEAYCLTVAEFVQKDKALSEFSKVWHENLKISSNVATTQSYEPIDHIAQPFDSTQKQTPYVLLKHKCGAKEWEVNLLDQDDATFFLDYLGNPRDSVISEGWEVVLYDLSNQIIKISWPGTLSEQQIREDKEAAMLLAQAKFFNGYTEYTEIEEEQLQLWIKTQGAEKMQTFFNTVITRYREHQADLIDEMNPFFTKALE